MIRPGRNRDADGRGRRLVDASDSVRASRPQPYCPRRSPPDRPLVTRGTRAGRRRSGTRGAPSRLDRRAGKPRARDGLAAGPGHERRGRGRARRVVPEHPAGRHVALRRHGDGGGGHRRCPRHVDPGRVRPPDTVRSAPLRGVRAGRVPGRADRRARAADAVGGRRHRVRGRSLARRHRTAGTSPSTASSSAVACPAATRGSSRP